MNSIESTEVTKLIIEFADKHNLNYVDLWKYTSQIISLCFQYIDSRIADAAKKEIN